MFVSALAYISEAANVRDEDAFVNAVRQTADAVGGDPMGTLAERFFNEGM